MFLISFTVNPKSLDPFYIIVTYNIKWTKTSWTYRTDETGKSAKRLSVNPPITINPQMV